MPSTSALEVEAPPRAGLLAEDADSRPSRTKKALIVAAGLALVGTAAAVGVSAAGSGSSAAATGTPTVASVSAASVSGDPYRAAVDLSLSTAGYAAIAYKPVAPAAEASAGRRRLTTAAELIEEGGYTLSAVTSAAQAEHALSMYRLRASFEYDYVVLTGASPDALEAHTDEVFQFTTGDSGLPVDNLCARVEGTPSWELLMTNYHVTDDPDEYAGAVALDAECYVVWYHEAHLDMSLSVMPVQQLPDGNVAIMETLGRVGQVILEEWYPDGDTCVANGQMPTWHHELTFDLENPDDLLFLDEELLDWSSGEDESMVLLADVFSVYHRETGEFEQLYNLGDLVSPADMFPTEYPVPAPCGSDVAEGVTVMEWSHGNTLSAGANDNYIYSSRFFDAVMAVARDGSGLQYILGSELSDFAFPDPNDIFEDQHGVWEISHDAEANTARVLMMDNEGWNNEATDRRNTSRGLELELDFNSMEARSVWSWEPEEDFQMYCCGYTQRWFLDGSGDERRLLAFGGYSAEGWDGNLIVEVDMNTDEAVHRLEVQSDDRMLFRATTAEGLAGEVSVPSL